MSKLSTIFFFGLAACMSTPEPSDQSAAQHDAIAAQEEREAAQHEASYDRDAVKFKMRCATGEDDPGAACWTSTINPTDKQLKVAAELRRIAARHRAASAALREVEERACAGLPDVDRDESPFDHREDILAIEPLEVITLSAKGASAKSTRGAVVTFRGVKGMTAERLQRHVDCHMARNAALGFNVPEMPNCPLALKNVSAHVEEVDGAFTIEVASANPATAKEILRRVRAIVGQ